MAQVKRSGHPLDEGPFRGPLGVGTPSGGNDARSHAGGVQEHPEGLVLRRVRRPGVVERGPDCQGAESHPRRPLGLAKGERGMLHRQGRRRESAGRGPSARSSRSSRCRPGPGHRRRRRSQRRAGARRTAWAAAAPGRSPSRPMSARRASASAAPSVRGWGRLGDPVSRCPAGSCPDGRPPGG